MSVLPASVRLSLWASAAFGGGTPMEQVLSRALPDADVVDGEVDRIGLWRDVGERVVLVALPRSGDLTGMPPSSPELVAAATAAGECVFVPGLGGALVPEVTAYGPDGDRGTRITWTAYEAEPLAVHRLEALSLAEMDLQFRLELRELTAELERLDVRPWLGDSARSDVDIRLAAGRWGLPEGMPPRAVHVLSAAARAANAAETALSGRSPAVMAQTDAHRQALLLRLQASAETTLATATNVAALHLSGLRR